MDADRKYLIALATTVIGFIFVLFWISFHSIPAAAIFLSIIVTLLSATVLNITKRSLEDWQDTDKLARLYIAYFKNIARHGTMNMYRLAEARNNAEKFTNKTLEKQQYEVSVLTGDSIIYRSLGKKSIYEIEHLKILIRNFEMNLSHCTAALKAKVDAKSNSKQISEEMIDDIKDLFDRNAKIARQSIVINDDIEYLFNSSKLSYSIFGRIWFSINNISSPYATKQDSVDLLEDSHSQLNAMHRQDIESIVNRFMSETNEKTRIQTILESDLMPPIKLS